MPRTKTDIRTFLGLTGYYREFYRNEGNNYSEDALPLTELTTDAHPNILPADLAKELCVPCRYISCVTHPMSARCNAPVPK